MATEEHNSVETVVSLAAREAVEAGYSQITTAHLLIALSRASEGMDSCDSLSSEDLRREFEHLGIQPRTFRRRLRVMLGRGESKASREVLHRSPTCRAVFAAAEQVASAAGAPLTPVLLLRSVFASFGDHEAGENTATTDDIPAEL